MCDPNEVWLTMLFKKQRKDWIRRGCWSNWSPKDELSMGSFSSKKIFEYYQKERKAILISEVGEESTF